MKSIAQALLFSMLLLYIAAEAFFTYRELQLECKRISRPEAQENWARCRGIECVDIVSCIWSRF